MTVIPVLDLLRGQVVRAVRGDRSAYRPIDSPLCNSSEPVAVAKVLCGHCASRLLYVADLDALQQGPVQAGVLRALLHALPDVELWVDAGFRSAADAAALRLALGPPAGRMVAVFGSESIASRAELEALGEGLKVDSSTHPPARPDWVLSLDRRDGHKLDAAGCWNLPALWPRRVIVMTLERVGADAGPDLQTLAEVQALAPHAALIGAGGIRNDADLARARRAGAHAWLVASALHDLRLARVAA